MIPLSPLPVLVVGGRLGSALPLLSSSLLCVFRLQEHPPAMSAYPDQIPAQTQGAATQGAAPRDLAAQPVIYRQKPGYYAVHYAETEINPAGATLVLANDAGGTIAIFSGDPPTSKRRAGPEPPAEVITPVYSSSADGIAAVPTGQVFVRFALGVDARDRQADFQKAGYTLVKVLDFAPQGAWVKASSGQIADGLAQLQTLQGLEQLEIIEPQMLMERSFR